LCLYTSQTCVREKEQQSGEAVCVKEKGLWVLVEGDGDN